MKRVFSVTGAGDKKSFKKAVKHLYSLEGVDYVSGSFRKGLVSVRFDPDAVLEKDITDTLSENGINAAVYENRLSAAFVMRLWPAIVISLAMLYMSYASVWRLPLPGVLGYPVCIGIMQLVMLVPVWILCRGVLRSGKFSARSRTPGLYSLALLGAAASALYSVPALVIGAMHISRGESWRLQLYFDCAALIPVMIYIGQALEMRARAKIEQAFKKHVGELPGSDLHINDTVLMKRMSRLTNLLVVCVLLLAAGAGVYWYLRGEGMGFAVHTFVCVLVIACPCAPGLAVPAIMTGGITREAQKGIWVKDAPALERVSGADTVIVYDESGFLKSDAAVSGCVLTPNTSERLLIAMAASALQASESAYARAIQARARDMALPLDPVIEFEEDADSGVRALIGDTRVLIGTYAFMIKNAMDMSFWEEKKETLADEGCTSIFIATAGRVQGALLLRETLPAEARAALEGFKRMGVKAYLICAEKPRAAEVALTQAGFESILHPEDARMQIRLMKADKHKLLGVYSADECPAEFEGVPLKMALGAQSEEIHTTSHSLRAAFDACSTASRSLRVIRKDLLEWLIFVLIGIPIAAGALYKPLGFALSPMLATPFMLRVCMLMLRNRPKKEKPEPTEK